MHTISDPEWRTIEAELMGADAAPSKASKAAQALSAVSMLAQTGQNIAAQSQQSNAMVPTTPQQPSGPNWFMQVSGGLPNIAWVGIGAVGIGVTIAIIRSMRKS